MGGASFKVLHNKFISTMMKEPFKKLKDITDNVYADYRKGFTQSEAVAIVELVEKSGYKLRQIDGKLVQVNFSIPTSNNDSFVVGLRYEKRNGTNTEDHFVFKKGEQKIIAYYKGSLEGEFPEYKGTHKAQIYN